MRALFAILPPFVGLALLNACAQPRPEPAADQRALQETACAAVIAAHVGRPLAEVTASWRSEAGGIASVETLDGERRHLCDVDATGQVLGYTHPGA